MAWTKKTWRDIILWVVPSLVVLQIMLSAAARGSMSMAIPIFNGFMSLIVLAGMITLIVFRYQKVEYYQGEDEFE